MSLVAFPGSPGALSPHGTRHFNPQASLTQTTKCQRLRQARGGRNWRRWRGGSVPNHMQHLAMHPPPW